MKLLLEFECDRQGKYRGFAVVVLETGRELGVHNLGTFETIKTMKTAFKEFESDFRSAFGRFILWKLERSVS